MYLDMYIVVHGKLHDNMRCMPIWIYFKYHLHLQYTQEKIHVDLDQISLQCSNKNIKACRRNLCSKFQRETCTPKGLNPKP